ncbi:MAG TPA: acetyl-CoA carboxylase biotin carboxyl carrier protein [Polyangiaceae bacterium]
MELEKLRQLFDLLVEKDIAEFEHEQGGVRVKVTRGARVISSAATTGNVGLAAIASPAAASVVPPRDNLAAITGPNVPSEAGADFVDVTSPFVGSFYRSPSPDTPAFVDVGSVVRAGQTLCIIEAMKLMNEIEAECAGTVVEIFAQNGKSVEYGQKLFRIKKA